MDDTKKKKGQELQAEFCRTEIKKGCSWTLTGFSSQADREISGGRSKSTAPTRNSVGSAESGQKIGRC